MNIRTLFHPTLAKQFAFAAMIALIAVLSAKDAAAQPCDTLVVPVGSPNNAVRAAIEYDGKFIVGGLFTTIAGVPVNHLAFWNGASWQAFEGGANGPVRGLAIHNGELFVSGEFTSIGGIDTVNILQMNDTLVVAGHFIGNDILFWRDCASACCVNGACLLLTETQCAAVGGTYFGPGVACDDVACDPIKPSCLADLNGSGAVDVQDLLILLSNWGMCP